MPCTYASSCCLARQRADSKRLLMGPSRPTGATSSTALDSVAVTSWDFDQLYMTRSIFCKSPWTGLAARVGDMSSMHPLSLFRIALARSDSEWQASLLLG